MATKLTKTDSYNEYYEMYSMKGSRQLAKQRCETDAILEAADEAMRKAKAQLKMARARAMVAAAKELEAEVEKDEMDTKKVKNLMAITTEDDG